jgi:hypothetical protein
MKNATQISEKKNCSIEKAQELRKEGFIIVVNNTYNKVLLVTKIEDKAYDLKKQFLLKNKVVKIFFPLIKMGLTNKDRDVALSELKLGKNYR